MPTLQTSAARNCYNAKSTPQNGLAERDGAFTAIRQITVGCMVDQENLFAALAMASTRGIGANR
ncbi:MAG: hypothetical protein VX963_04445 [Actinomycetota bacterium]|nr:hypothetical protein [Acidimicrobiaceae bacterium]MEC7915511.1 hypothetical protein [Actinomycetota bacterium]MEC9058371.1 hypothetical protein [Actinomycetota bacterium]MED5362285.1 hypothetical protein [Actinomycetota bacterium]